MPRCLVYAYARPMIQPTSGQHRRNRDDIGEEEHMFGSWFRRRSGANRAANGSSSNGNAHLIELRDVLKVYETAAGKFTALKSIDIQIDRGEFVANIGKS